MVKNRRITIGFDQTGSKSIEQRKQITKSIDHREGAFISYGPMIILLFVNKLPSCDKPKSNPFSTHSKIVFLSFTGHVIKNNHKTKISLVEKHVT